MNDMNDLISVVVPIYNTEKYLARCVESIRNQSYSNLEIILVDDGSPDQCSQMCDAWAAEDLRIKVIHKQNAGQGLARNDGLEIASGKYITFIDSDDWISVTHIETMYNAIDEYQVDAILGNHTRVNIDGTYSERLLLLEEGVYDRAHIVEKLLIPLIGAEPNNQRDVLINSSVSMNLYSLDLIQTKGIRFISERFAVAEDFFFNVDFFQYAQRVAYIKETGYYYFQNMESTCEKYNPKRFERTLNYYSVLTERAAHYGILEQVEQRIHRSFLMKIRVALRHIVLSDLSQKEKYHQISEILNNDTVSRVLASYPIEAYISPMRLLAKCMLRKDTNWVYLLILIREKARRTKMTKKLLHLIGIGK